MSYAETEETLGNMNVTTEIESTLMGATNIVCKSSKELKW